MGFSVESEEVVHRGALVTLVRAQVRPPEGDAFERELVRHPGAVVVVPLVSADRALLVRQYRAAVDRELLELPAGKRDVAGEPPETTAARELVEEVGRRAGSLELLAEFYNSPGFSDEHTFLYLATGLTEVPDSRQGPEEAAMTLEEVPLAAVERLVSEREIVDAKTIIGLTLARLRTHR